MPSLRYHEQSDGPPPFRLQEIMGVHLKNPTSRMHVCTEQLALEMIQVYVQQKEREK